MTNDRIVDQPLYNQGKELPMTQTSNMNFGEAIEAMKNGACVARSGWNGKGMHVYIEDAHTVEIDSGVYKGSFRRREAHFVIYTADGTHQPGWLASQADMLANDWGIVA